MAWGQNASCLWLLAALLALHISASAQSETPCGYNIHGDGCVKKGSAGSWGLNEGKKSSEGGSRSAPLNSIAFVGIFVFAVFAMRALFVLRLRQQRLQLEGAGSSQTGTSAGSDFMCLRSNGCKQILKDDLVKLTTAGDEGTLWVMLSKSKTNRNDPCETVVEITPVHWKRVKQGTEEPCPHEEDHPSKFGLSRDSSVSLTSGGDGSQAEHEAQNQNSDAVNRTVDASGRSSATGVGKELQPLGDACCICLERCSDVRFGKCKHAAVCRECWLTTLHTWKQNTAPTCPMCRMPVPSFSVFDAARGVCDEESQQGGGTDAQRQRSVLAFSQDQGLGGGVPQPYSLARRTTPAQSAEAATPGTPSGGGGLTAWLTRPLTSRREMRPFETQPSVMYHFDSSQENAAASPSAGPMRPIESPSVRPLASGATLGNAPVEDVAMSLTASIVFPSAEAPAEAVSHPYRISTAPGVLSNV